MTAYSICPDSPTCRMKQICREFISLEVNNQCVLWEKDFAIAMIRHYHNHEIPFSIRRNCTHPDWEKMSRKYEYGATARALSPT
jgi:hypothetical protein